MDKSVLRWGGLAGMLAGILFLLNIGIVASVTLMQLDEDPEELVMRFPDISAALTVGEGLYLVAIILLVALFLALYRALRGTSLTPALGSVLGVMGLVMLAVGSLVYVAFAHVSALYHAPGATPEEQATLVLIWQATQGIFNATDAVGLLLVTTGLIVLGVAMLGAPAFGKGFGGASVVLGVVGVVGMSLFVVSIMASGDPVSPIAIVGIFLGGLVAVIIFPLLFGWKVYSLSRAA